MNRSFRSVWNASLGAWVAASELSRACHSGAGRQTAVFAQLGVVLALMGAYAPAHAINYFWDINGATAGAGGGTAPTGAWSTGGTTWSTNINGTVATPAVTTTTADVLTFSAGTTATGLYTITVNGTQAASRLIVQEGTVTFTGGTLNFGTAAGIINGNTNVTTINSALNGSTVTVNGGTIVLNGANTLTGSFSVSGTTTLRAGSTSAFGSGRLLISGASAVVDLNGFNNSVGSLASSGLAPRLQLGSATLTTGSDNNSTAFSGEISGTGGLTKVGTGTQTLVGTNIYTGATNINAGTVQLGTSGFVGSTFFNNTTGTLGTGAVNIAAGAALAFNRTNLYTVANTISGAGGLRQVNSGTTSLTATNSYTGPTTIDTGTVQAGAAAGGQAFGINSAVTLADAAGATLDLNNFSQAIGSLAGGGSTGGNVTLGSATLTTGGDNTSTSFGGAISGTGGLTKVGTGTQVLTGSNLYSGGTTITAGTLQIGDGGTAGSIAGNVVNNGTLAFNRSDAVGFGGVITGAGTIRHMGSGLTTLTGNSAAFTGTTSVEAGTLSVNGSLCGAMNVQSGGRLQGTGTVCNTTNFAGAIVAPGNSIGTLKINGNYAGNGGVLEMEGVLAGTGSPADRLLITGNAMGATTVNVINTGGTGAVTGSGNTDGISLIQVGGTSTASTFQLAGGYAAAGPYQYRLNFFAPGASAAAQADPLLGTAVFGDYRLQSAVDATGAPIPVPQVGGYQSMPSGALRYGASMLNGVHQRLGDIRRLAWAGKEEGAPRSEFFLRGNSSSTEFDGDRGPGFNQDMQFVQVGGNFAKWNIGEAGSTLRLGGALSYGKSDLTVKGSNAKVDLKGTTLAMMGTWRGASDEYLDVVAQGTRYRSEVRTLERGNAGAPKGRGWGLSVEGGYPLKMGNGLIVEPQAQLSYQKVKFDRFTDVDNITVDLGNSASLRGRAGVRLQKADEGQQWFPFMEVNLLHEFLKGSTVNASGVGFGSDLGGTSAQLAAGLTGRLSRNASFFLTLGYEKGISKASADTWSGNVGVRMSF